MLARSSRVLKDKLPVDAHLPRIKDLVLEQGALVLVAEPGAGKTTRVPWALRRDGGRVICVQPRRVAASHAALRVCEELGQKVGAQVGYAVRFDSKQSAQTKVLYVTTGVFMRMLASGEGLGERDTVVLDEFHERSVDIDLALCACLAARKKRTGPNLIVMSATLDAEKLSTFLAAPRIEVPGRLHPVTVEYLPPRSGERDDAHIARAVRNLLIRAQKSGERMRALVFVPGRSEMSSARRATEQLRADFKFDTAELFGAQSFAEQKGVLRRRSEHEAPQVIFATRVAETSLTVPDLNAVVDTGLSRRARVDPSTGFTSLETRPSPRSSLEQRAGRAGRVGPGVCVRLFDEASVRGRPAFDKPELQSADCAGPALLLASLGVDAPPFLDPPPLARWQGAQAQLRGLGALDASGRITDKGAAMAAMPVHPRTAVMLLEAQSRQVSYRAAMMVAVLEERSPRRDESDFWSTLRWLLENTDARSAEAVGIDRTTLRAIFRSADRLANIVGARDEAVRPMDEEQADLEACLLQGFSQRLGRIAGARLATVDGSSFELPEPPGTHTEGQFAIVLGSKGPLGRQQAVSIAPVAEDSVLEVFLDRFQEQTTWHYDAKADRVLKRAVVSLGAVEVEASESKATSGAEVAAVLREVIDKSGLGAVLDLDERQTLRRRLELLGEATASIDEGLERTLAQACASASSLADVRSADPLSVFRYSLAPERQRALEEQTPLRIDIPGRRGVEVHYEPDRPPWAASYLQEFFGMTETPRVAGTPLTLHLWAPNGRAVQVTSDLPGFWERHYPALRKELSRRYPKHHWPEDPLNAKPVRLKRYL